MRRGTDGRSHDVHGPERTIVADLSDVAVAPAVLHHSLRHAIALDARVEVVSCIRPSVVSPDVFSMAWACGMEDEVLEAARRWQRSVVLETLGPSAAEHVIGYRVVAGDRVTELVSAADRAQLLVVARPARVRWWRPTVAERCSRRTRCAVMEVPRQADTEAARWHLHDRVATSDRFATVA